MRYFVRFFLASLTASVYERSDARFVQQSLVNGRAFKPSDWKPNGLPIVRIQNLNRETAEFNYADPDDVQSRHIIDSGTLLISWSGTPGTSFGAFIWNRGKAALNQHIFSCSQRLPVFADRFLQLAINTRLDELIAKAHGGVGLQHVTKGKLEALALALPPLAEQHRIVAKVDELMALCDRLEARQQDAEAAHVRLVQALLDSLTQARDADEFRTCWQRLVGQFSSIFSTDASIDRLKKAVLMLGVSGRLVPCGQSAAEASERSGAEPLWSTTHDWAWRTLGEVIESGIQNGISPKAAGTETPVRCLTLSATTRGKFDAACFKHVDLDNGIAGKYRLQPGDLLVQRANSIDYVGVSAVYDGDAGAFIFPDLMMRMRAGKLVTVEFLHLCLSAEPSRAYMRANATGTQGNMPKVNQGTVSGIPIPVPPLETQHCIVAKVIELLALCDQLKARITAARAKHAQLAEALVTQAVAV